MKIGIILLLIGVGLGIATYVSFIQLPALTDTQGAQTDAAANQWQTTFILGFCALMFCSIGIGTITSSIKRKAIQYVGNKVGNKLNDMGMGPIMSNLRRPGIASMFMPKKPSSPGPTPQPPSKPDGQSPPASK